MLLNKMNTLSAQELAENAQDHFFDKVIFVTDDLQRVTGNLKKYCALGDWKLETKTQLTNPALKVMTDGVPTGIEFSETHATAKMGNLTLCGVQPGSGNTAYKKYFDRYGEGLCCLSELIPSERWEETLSHFKSLGLPVIQTEETSDEKTIWFDAMELIGGLLELHWSRDESLLKTPVNDRIMIQVNITTDNVDRTVAELATIYRCGPWSMGTLNNESIQDPGLLVDGELTAPEFHFQLGITRVGNIELESIQPVKGPTVYRDYIERHGVGFHHIKEIFPETPWSDTVAHFSKLGLQFCIKGQVGETCFAYLNTEHLFGFHYELGDGKEPGWIPESYKEYSYPAAGK